MGPRVGLVMLAVACGGGSGEPNVDASIDAPTVPKVGFVLVTQVDDAIGFESFASASFSFLEPDPVIGSDGPCTATTPSSSANRVYVSGGVISMTGTVEPVTLIPSGTKPTVAYFVGLPSPPFNAGAVVTAQSMGTSADGGFPAFSGSVTAPATVMGFTSPNTVSRAGYTVTWTAGGAQSITIHLRTGAPNSAVRHDVDCIVPDTGSFAISAAVFALIPATDVYVETSVIRAGTVVIVPQHVTLTASSIRGSRTVATLTN